MVSNLSSKVHIAIIVAKESEDIEVVVPYDLWKRAGISVEKISIEKKNTIVLQSGGKIYCEDILDKTNLDRFQAIYLPGGRGHVRFLDEKLCERLHNSLTKFVSDPKKWILSICAAPTVLMDLNLITDQKLTVYPGFEEKIGKNFSNDDVVCDKNIITAKSPFFVFDFSLLVIEKLINKQVANNVASSILYKKV